MACGSPSVAGGSATGHRHHECCSRRCSALYRADGLLSLSLQVLLLLVLLLLLLLLLAKGLAAAADKTATITNNHGSRWTRSP